MSAATMRSLPTGNPTEPGLKPFWLSLAALNLTLAIAGVILAQRYGVSAAIAVPVVTAFAWQLSVYWAAVFERTRARLEAILGPGGLAAALVVASVTPYLIYSVPTGIFAWDSALKLGALCWVITFVYIAFPASGSKLTWQDLVVALVIAYPMVSGLSPLFEDVYQGFDAPANRLDSLGKLMLIPLGLLTFLSLRKLQGTGFRLIPRREDWRPALESFLYGSPLIAIVALSTGYARWNPHFDDPAYALLEALGKLLGIYLTTALAEEFLLRGVVQNLLARTIGRPLVAQAAAAVLFGATHLGRGDFPNWPYFATTVVLGWFCGRAYAKSGSITPAMITHTSVVVTQTLLFE